jgi:hypothetical protein
MKEIKLIIDGQIYELIPVTPADEQQVVILDNIGEQAEGFVMNEISDFEPPEAGKIIESARAVIEAFKKEADFHSHLDKYRTIRHLEMALTEYDLSPPEVHGDEKISDTGDGPAGKIGDITKIADVHKSQISQKLFDYLSDRDPEYFDKLENMNEHLHSLETILEDMEDLDADLIEEITALKKELDVNDCAYLRITII